MATATTNAEVAWQGAPAGAVGQTAAWVGIWSALTGGTFYAGVQVTNSPSALALGEVYYIAAGGLVITQTAASQEAEVSAQRALRGRLGGVTGAVETLYYAIHTGDTGNTGANELTQLARVAVQGNAFTYA